MLGCCDAEYARPLTHLRPEEDDNDDDDSRAAEEAVGGIELRVKACEVAISAALATTAVLDSRAMFLAPMP